jgi:hypothetical protein
MTTREWTEDRMDDFRHDAEEELRAEAEEAEAEGLDFRTEDYREYERAVTGR